MQSAIEQNFAGSGGAFRQMNLEKQRSYSLPQWRKICDSSEHQPPAKRGEARRMGGRKSQNKKKPMQTPATPPPNTDSDSGSPEPQESAKPRKPRLLDDAEFQDFDYRIDDNDQYTPERCQELEKSYWKSLTFNNPMYGADLPGSLFDDNTKEWNVAHLDNILNRLGVTLPGVNSAYLYLGMWKATFSWHVEDMDLYSINYIHFGAPKQWYSVSQDDNQKFEKVMKDIFPNDARHCGQFMRHKTFGASPARLAQHDLHVNKLVHYEKEFVITFPYGYHSGYNLGYNCAESVNFATEEWLEYGKVAQKCQCVTDAVSIDVNDIIRAVNGESLVEFDEDEMLTPPASEDGSNPESTERRTYSEFDRVRRTNTKKRKKDVLYDAAPVVRYKKLSEKYHGRTSDAPLIKPIIKRIKLSLPKAPCDLCPRAPIYDDILDAGDGRKVHRICADFIPETSIAKVSEGNDKEQVLGFNSIDKARLALKCSHCRSSSGACFQCSSPKCVRAFHGTCAYDAGVLVQKRETVEGESVYHFSCKTHRPRRAAADTLEFDQSLTQYAAGLQKATIVQAQFTFGHVFSGLVRENRRTERTLIIEVGNAGDMIEVDYQWVLAMPKRAMKTAQAQKSDAFAKEPQVKAKTQGSEEVPTNISGVDGTMTPFPYPDAVPGVSSNDNAVDPGVAVSSGQPADSASNLISCEAPLTSQETTQVRVPQAFAMQTYSPSSTMFQNSVAQQVPQLQLLQPRPRPQVIHRPVSWPQLSIESAPLAAGPADAMKYQPYTQMQKTHAISPYQLGVPQYYRVGSNVPISLDTGDTCPVPL